MLNHQQKQHFAEQGYLILPGLIPAEEAADLRRDLFATLARPWTGSKRLSISYDEAARDVDPENPLGASFVMQSPLLGERWFKLALDWRLVEPIVDLLGPDINLHDQKIPLKPPGHVSQQRWHQDWIYEKHDRPELAAVLLYLDDTAPGAGATMLAPGSHQRGELVHDRPDFHAPALRDELITEDILQPSMKAGDAVIIHTWLAHRVGDNHTNQTRSMVAHVYKTRDAIDIHGNTRAFAELPVARNGQPAMTMNW